MRAKQILRRVAPQNDIKDELTQPTQQNSKIKNARSALRGVEAIDKAAFIELAHEARVD